MEVCIRTANWLTASGRIRLTRRAISRRKDELQLLLATIGIVVAVILGPVSE